MDDRTGLPQTEAGEAAGPSRLLVASVYIMGVLLVLCFLGLIAAIGWKALGGRGQAPTPTQLLDLGLPPGTSVQNIAVDRDRLIINTGNEVLVVDTKQNRIVSRITVAPK